MPDHKKFFVTREMIIKAWNNNMVNSHYYPYIDKNSEKQNPYYKMRLKVKKFLKLI